MGPFHWGRTRVCTFGCHIPAQLSHMYSFYCIFLWHWEPHDYPTMATSVGSSPLTGAPFCVRGGLLKALATCALPIGAGQCLQADLFPFKGVAGLLFYLFIPFGVDEEISFATMKKLLPPTFIRPQQWGELIYSLEDFIHILI